MLRGWPALVALVAVALCVTVSGCKKKTEPEHVVQQRRREAARKKRQAALAAGKVKPRGDPRDRHAGGAKKDDHGKNRKSAPPLPLEVVDTSKWSEDLKGTLVTLLQAAPPKVPPLALKLAFYGRPGYQALRVVVRQTSQPRSKRAAASFLLAEGHMFDPEELERMGGEALTPYLQRAAIDRLAQLKDPFSQKLLRRLAGLHTPMAAFIARANKRPGGNFTRAQLKTLDNILNPKDVKALKKQLLAIKGPELEAGLVVILRTKVSRPTYKGLVAKRLVMLAARGDRQRLRRYAMRDYPPLLRVAAVQELFRSRSVADRKVLAELATNKKDPIAPLVKKRLANGG